MGQNWIFFFLKRTRPKYMYQTKEYFTSIELLLGQLFRYMLQKETGWA